MATEGQGSRAQHPQGMDETECVAPSVKAFNPPSLTGFLNQITLWARRVLAAQRQFCG